MNVIAPTSPYGIAHGEPKSDGMMPCGLFCVPKRTEDGAAHAGLEQRHRRLQHADRRRAAHVHRRAEGAA
jgi:hypothetical protein